jgi:hypothetical protein
MIKFKTGGGRNLIEPVEVEKETASSVWINGRRNNKRSGYDSYFDTWEEAKAYLLEQAERKVAGRRRSLEAANGELGNIRGLKKPE